jgi:hypothetical protein
MLDATELALLDAFIAHRVRFLIGGSHAVAAHGLSRQPRDLDVIVSPSTVNVRRLIGALSVLGLGGVPSDRLTRPRVRLRVPRYNTDFLTAFDARAFAVAYRRRCDRQHGTLVLPFLSLTDLLTTKRGTNRPKDRRDVRQLERQHERRVPSATRGRA